MLEKQFSIQKSVRYVTVGEPTSLVKNVWVCLHGYGQLARFFARNFSAFQNEERLFIIPEGPHHFYLNGTSGRVGASWMTKENRLADIEDQFYYLENLVSNTRNLLADDCKMHVLGFSQGVSTALRWVNKTTLPIKSVICWAGSFPPDIDYKLQSDKFAAYCMHTCFGNADEYISEEDARKLLAQLKEQNIKITPHFYAGGHKIYPELLGEILKEAEQNTKP